MSEPTDLSTIPASLLAAELLRRETLAANPPGTDWPRVLTLPVSTPAALLDAAVGALCLPEAARLQARLTLGAHQVGYQVARDGTVLVVTVDGKAVEEVL